MSPQELERQLEELHPASYAWSVACCRGDDEEAREVLQVTYLKILEGSARFDGRSSLKTWLFAVIRRTCDGRRRRRFLRRDLLASWGRRRPQDPPPRGPRQRLLDSEQAARVRAAVSALSRRQRQVLELVFFHDLSLRQTADVLGISAGAASVHYHRGKRELLARLGES